MIVIPASREYNNNVNDNIRIFIDSLVLKNYSSRDASMAVAL
jgi:hypothetical protein